MNLANSRRLLTMLISTLLLGCEQKSSYPENTLTIASTQFESAFAGARFYPNASVERHDNGRIQQASELEVISFNIRLSSFIPEVKPSIHGLITVTIKSGVIAPLDIKDFRLDQSYRNDLNVDFPLYKFVASPSTDRHAFLQEGEMTKSFWCRMYKEQPQFCIGAHNINAETYFTYKLHFNYLQHWPTVNDYLEKSISSKLLNEQS